MINKICQIINNGNTLQGKMCFEREQVCCNTEQMLGECKCFSEEVKQYIEISAILFLADNFEHGNIKYP